MTGRPKGPETTVVSVRMPRELRERLYRRLDRLYRHHGVRTSMSALLGHAAEQYLDHLDTEDKHPELARLRLPKLTFPSFHSPSATTEKED